MARKEPRFQDRVELAAHYNFLASWRANQLENAGGRMYPVLLDHCTFDPQNFLFLMAASVDRSTVVANVLSVSVQTR